MQLSKEQNLVFEKYKDGKNVFMTGPGGTGKTHLIKLIVEDLKSTGKKYQVCALTGCAAVLLNCGAKTLHSWSGIGLANNSIRATVDRVLKSRHRRKNWNKVEVLIVDEVSMLSLKVLIILDIIARTIKKKETTPFGGIQIIFSGDFYQLPPVGDKDDPKSSQFCFEYDDWWRLFDYQIELTHIFRQEDEKFSKILNDIRVGRIRKSSWKLLQEYIRLPNKDEPIKPPIILSRRADVDNINRSELANLPGEEFRIKYKEAREISSLDEKAKEFINKKDIDEELNYIKNNIMAVPELVLKKGALVMCIANIDMESANPIVNGSQGIVIDFVNDFPRVRFSNGEIRTMSYHTWASEKIPEIGIMQIPLIHSWAITIHKAQGASLESAQIDVGNKIFECGQTYVALSRVKSLDGLYLVAFDPSKIKIYKKVAEFYENLTKTNI
jgi:ATP-dependent DNA helicase PIF1